MTIPQKVDKVLKSLEFHSGVDCLCHIEDVVDIANEVGIKLSLYFDPADSRYRLEEQCKGLTKKLMKNQLIGGKND